MYVLSILFPPPQLSECPFTTRSIAVRGALLIEHRSTGRKVAGSIPDLGFFIYLIGICR